MEFKPFKQAIQRQFKLMASRKLFRVQLDGTQLWELYLASFPAGTNPIFRERTEHDCSCCRQFIKNIGGVIAFADNGEIMTIWDIVPTGVADGYCVVAKALADAVRRSPIDNEYRHYESVVGTDKNFEDATGGTLTWEHFHITLPQAVVLSKDSTGPYLSGVRSGHDVLLRSLKEITVDTVDTVLELIQQNSLYRGAEHTFALTEFRKVLTASVGTRNMRDLDDFAWLNSVTGPVVATRIRNTSIGTLLVDIQEGMELEDAVKKFEVMVAPANYKRPIALVTKKQIEQAKAKIEELNLTSALERRYARIEDITVNNVLFADRDARKAMGGDVFDALADNVKVDAKSLDKVEEVSLAKFLTDILPKVQSIEAFVDNKHGGNFMSLIAPVDASAPGLFKWPNGFSWTYSGDVTDSIKERVKQAGGNVTGELCCRLAWDYTDDLDFHMREPGGGHIYFSNRRQKSRCGGMLDVDANGIDGIRPNPCENIFYERISTMFDGAYLLMVHNYNRRSGGTGFEVEIDVRGTIHRFVYDRVIASGQHVVIANIHVKKGEITIEPSLPSTTASKQVWNVSTQTFRRVTAIMRSPNYWDGHGVGNEHVFFMLDGCMNDGKARGFYNEFLHNDLTPHRKVLEMVGSKMKTDESEHQLSGLGFSVTQRNELLLRVKGNFTRTIKVLF